ncbi:ribosome-recycling factor, mitochondrial [Drosophila grimshawi]|uniref:Ribosome-recycling factor, mitochondrial n=1 Tax=Drosophila grimshawi TaxID=7222 RepID=B4IYH5_DROGR|nr:ribosome-recycling factor, mitochondrial [Drosophila grimshawi]EDV97648.1 GH14583 [Drosophila grimshawi]
MLAKTGVHLRAICTRLTPLRVVLPISRQVLQQQQPQVNAAAPALFVQQTRDYAKGKDRKKEKGAKGKPVKVEINEQQLRELINLDGLNAQMEKSVLQMRDDFIKNLSLRSTSGAIDTLRIKVDGAEHELQQLAQISRKNPKTIVINMIAFPQTIPDVLRAIEKSGMNLNPQQDGTTLFIPIPKVTKEHREHLSKNAKALFIKHRDAIRDIQNAEIRKLKKQTDIAKDDVFAAQTQLTAIADKYIGEADKLLASKQKELLGDA